MNTYTRQDLCVMQAWPLERKIRVTQAKILEWYHHYKGKVAVAAVVLNRVKSSSFPNSISGVIYQKGAFSAVSDGQINLSPDNESIKAARDAMNGWDPTGGCLYYYNPKKTSNKWMLSHDVVLSIGEHAFF